MAATDGEYERRAKVAAAVAAVRDRFVEGFSSRVDELARLAEAVEAGDAEAREALRRGLHTVAGTAPTLGLEALGATARALEARLSQDGGLRPDDLRRAFTTPRPESRLRG